MAYLSSFFEEPLAGELGILIAGVGDLADINVDYISQLSQVTYNCVLGNSPTQAASRQSKILLDVCHTKPTTASLAAAVQSVKRCTPLYRDLAIIGPVHRQQHQECLMPQPQRRLRRAACLCRYRQRDHRSRRGSRHLA